MTSLKTLNLSSTAILQFDFLSDLACLKSLDLSHTGVSSIEALQACVSLEKLKVSGCSNLKDLSALPLMSGLTHFDFSILGRIFNQNLMESISASTSIKKLDLSSEGASFQSLLVVNQWLPLREKLLVSSC
jgi:Leucine-rich repeat (LRR) protein